MDWNAVLDSLKASLANMRYVKSDNPMGVVMQDMTPEQKDLAVKESFAASTLGFALPGVGFGAVAPAALGLPTMLPGVTDEKKEAKKDEKKDKKKKKLMRVGGRIIEI